MSGEGNFNWRFVFRFDFLDAEERIVHKKKANKMSLVTHEEKLPAKLYLSVWDADLIKSDDCLGTVQHLLHAHTHAYTGSLTLDLCRLMNKATTADDCTLAMLDPARPTVNIFKQRRLRGWYPFTANTIEGQLEMAVSCVKCVP
jgi:hypothetical protein